ncbi:MAG: tRNA (uracil-5-)-methyltransferase [Elusimicrobia bacterium RIFCSPLOWO2_12_FULL_59_9]|nr:MAG: tRNA (uracil-5-)-methyltransferase [Elusimicrobia bacterium RIFCSPLOWO2_12_FULL_59_9]
MKSPGQTAALLDPPRSGLSPLALERLARREFARIIYVSCDPASFARDARRLADRGYALKEVQPVDLFPQTAHVELAARLDRLR